MAAAFLEVYGPEPKEIDIMFPSDNPEDFFPQDRRRYGSGTGLICKGDGLSAWEVNRETGEMVQIECKGKECPYSIPDAKGQIGCKPVGTLYFLIPNVPGLGCWQMDTGSFNSIVQINSALAFISQLTGGKLALIPLKLVRRPREVVVEGKKKTVYVVDVAMRHLSLNDVLKARRDDAARIFLPSPATTDEALDYEPSVPDEDEILEPPLPPITVPSAFKGLSPVPVAIPEATPIQPEPPPPDEEYAAALQAALPQAVITTISKAEVEKLDNEMDAFLKEELGLHGKRLAKNLKTWNEGEKTRARLDAAKQLLTRPATELQADIPLPDEEGR